VTLFFQQVHIEPNTYRNRYLKLFLTNFSTPVQRMAMIVYSLRPQTIKQETVQAHASQMSAFAHLAVCESQNDVQQLNRLKLCEILSSIGAIHKRVNKLAYECSTLKLGDKSKQRNESCKN